MIDLSGNYLENIPEDLFLENVELETVIWENDSCSTKNRNRTFPENLFEKNNNLSIFRYSNNTSSCEKIIFPPKLFSSLNSSLSELKISGSASLQWNDIKWLVQGRQNLTDLDLTGNNITYEFNKPFFRMILP